MSSQPFSLRDCVMLAVVGLILTVGLIGCGGGTNNDQRMLNMTQIRGIQQGLVLFSQSNSNRYPGLTSDGKLAPAIKPAANLYGAPQASNSDISIVYASLLNGEFFTPDYLLHPLDVGTKKAAPARSTLHTITRANYSYAVLQFGNPVGNEGRRYEWQDTNNSMAPVVVDRSSLIDPSLKTTGMHTGDTSGDPTKWVGSVAWNDNHITHEASAVFETNKLKFGSTPNPSPDNIFNATDGASPDNNAMFTY